MPMEGQPSCGRGLPHLQGITLGPGCVTPPAARKPRRRRRNICQAEMANKGQWVETGYWNARNADAGSRNRRANAREVAEETMSPRRIAIIGASLAGATAAASLRQGGFDGELELIGAEVQLPYNRPPLSKGYLRG